MPYLKIILFCLVLGQVTALAFDSRWPCPTRGCKLGKCWDGTWG